MNVLTAPRIMFIHILPSLLHPPHFQEVIQHSASTFNALGIPTLLALHSISRRPSFPVLLRGFDLVRCLNRIDLLGRLRGRSWVLHRAWLHFSCASKGHIAPRILLLQDILSLDGLLLLSSWLLLLRRGWRLQDG